MPSESDAAPVSLQRRTYSNRFGTWKVRCLNQAWVSWSVGSDWIAYYLHLNSQPSKEDKKAKDDDKEEDDDDFDLFGSDEEEEDEEVCQKINKTFHV